MSNSHQHGYQTPRSPTGAGGSSAEQLSFSPSGLPSPIYTPDEITPPRDHHRFPPQPMPRARMRDVSVMQQPPGHPIQQDLASENTRLRERISQLEHKLQEKEKQIQEKEKKIQEKEKQASQVDMQEEYVRKLFEARVAVMGFKCRQLQLQGEVDHLQGMVSKSSETERQENMKAAQENEQKSLQAIIGTLQEDLQNLQGENSQYHSEMQRLQQVVRELQQENAALKSRQQQQQASISIQPSSTRDEQQHMWVVRREEIHFASRELGRGGWAVVQAAEFRGLTVAAKCLHHALISPYNRRLFVREMKIASSLRHPNLVQFIGATIEGQPIILTELMHSSLRATLERGPLNAAQIASISLDVARALNYLHLMQPDPIIHRDISSTNVLLNPLPSNGWRAKVSGYDSVNYLQHLKTAGPGNPTYAAPEADIPELQSPKMDVFSYGVLLLEMCSRKFPSVEERETCLYRVQQPAMVVLIRHCLEQQPRSRPDMSQILEHFNTP